MTSVSFSPGSGALAGHPLDIDREFLRNGKCLHMTERHRSAHNPWDIGKF